MTRSRHTSLSRTARISALIGLLCGAWTWLEVADEDVADGNQAFAARDLDEALSSYKRALERSGDDARVFYNIGVVLYEMARDMARRTDGGPGPDEPEYELLLERAGAAFARAALGSEQRGDTALAAMAHFGRGNVLYRESRWQDAVRAYQDALRANPRHDDARYNLQIAQARLDEHRPPGEHGAAPRGHAPRPDQGSDSNANRSPGATGDEDAGGGRRDDPESSPGRDARDTNDGRDAQKPGGGAPGGADDTGDPSRAGAGEQPGAAGDAGRRSSGQTSGSGRAPDDADGADGAEGADGSDGDADGGRASPSAKSGARASSQRELDKKLDALERLSRDLRHDKLRRDARGVQRGRVERDW